MEKTLKSFLTPRIQIDLSKQPQYKKTFLKEVNYNIYRNETKNTQKEKEQIAIKKQPSWMSDFKIDDSLNTPKIKKNINQSQELSHPNKFDLLIRRIETLAPASPKKVYGHANNSSVETRSKKNGFSLYDFSTVEKQQKSFHVNVQEHQQNSSRVRNLYSRQN